MLAVSLSNARVASTLGSRQPNLGHRPAAAAAAARPHQRCVRALAFKEGHRQGNGGTATLEASSDQWHATKMLNLTLEYFEELMSKGNVEVCHKILDPQVQHKDMVRNEGRYGISEYQRFISELKQTYPSIWVRPIQFGVVDQNTLFVAFEGKATEHTPLFKGVDLFHFNDDASKIKEVEVYRSNWLGAEGHEDRKKQSQQGRKGQPRLQT